MDKESPRAKLRKKKRSFAYGNQPPPNFPDILILENLGKAFEKLGAASRMLHELERRAKDKKGSQNARDDLYSFQQALICSFSGADRAKLQTLADKVSAALHAFDLKTDTIRTGGTLTISSMDGMQTITLPMARWVQCPEHSGRGKDALHKIDPLKERNALAVLTLQKAIQSAEEKSYRLAGEYLGLNLISEDGSPIPDSVWKIFFGSEIKALPALLGRKRGDPAIRCVEKLTGISMSTLSRDVANLKKRRPAFLRDKGLL